MAAPRKRGNKWFIEVRQGGVTKGKTFDSKGEASTWRDEMQAEIKLNSGHAGIPNATFGDLLKRYAIEVSPTKRGERWEQIRIAAIQKEPIASVKLRVLNETHIAEWRTLRLKSVSAGTVLREWTLLSAACSVAENEWKWLSFHPMKKVRRPKAPIARDRRISEHEITTLMFVLGYRKDIRLNKRPARVGAAVLFAIETAMRKGEILGLTWNKINFATKVATLELTKNGMRRQVPLSPEAIRILRQLQDSTSGDSVFNLSAPSLDDLFRKAKVKSMIDGLHFHDTRHEAITRLAKIYTVLELARITGHMDLNKLLIYYNETAEELAKKLG